MHTHTSLQHKKLFMTHAHNTSTHIYTYKIFVLLTSLVNTKSVLVVLVLVLVLLLPELLLLLLFLLLLLLRRDINVNNCHIFISNCTSEALVRNG